MSAFITAGVSGRSWSAREGNDSRTKVVSFQNEMGVESSRAPQRGKAPANLQASGRGASLTFLPHSLPLSLTRLLTSSPSPHPLMPIRSDRWAHCKSSGLGVRKFSSFSERSRVIFAVMKKAITFLLVLYSYRQTRCGLKQLRTHLPHESHLCTPSTVK